MKVLVTGAAGFIGSHVCLELLARGDDVVGVDNFNNYYDVGLKRARVERIEMFVDSIALKRQDLASAGRNATFNIKRMDIADRDAMSVLFSDEMFDAVVHLAAQAGVRHSLEQPFDYIDSNVTGFLTVLEGCRHTNVKHLVYASTSSVYGLNTNMPFSVQNPADHPVSLYGATKRSNELMAHSYSHLFGLSTTGLRFFTVYGPWGRPDMALFLFTKAILAGKPIDVFNGGKHVRDFTYVDDIVEGILSTLDKPAIVDVDWKSGHPSSQSSFAPWRVHNIGNGRPVELMRYIEVLEEHLGKKAKKNFLPLQAGDVPGTNASVETLWENCGYRPHTSIEVGISNFVKWYREYHS